MDVNQITKGDVLEVLQSIDSNTIHCGVTSPPYNKKKVGGGIFRKVEYENFDDDLPEDEYQSKQISILNELERVMIPGGSFFYNHKVRYYKGMMIHPIQFLSKTNWHIRQELVWNKMSAVEVSGYRFFQTEERIYWLYKPNNKVTGERLEGRDAKMNSVWEISADRKNPHPAPFPLTIPLRCIMSVMRNVEEGIVIDPYMGSGTTAIAASLLGHNYIGIDNSQEYIDMAHDRIAEYNDPNNRKILEDEEKLHVVKKTYQQRKAGKSNLVEQLCYK